MAISKETIDKKKFFIDLLNMPENEIKELAITLQAQSELIKEMSEMANRIAALKNHTRCAASDIAHDFKIDFDRHEKIICNLDYVKR